jgi:5-methyltetrahydrofolate--homocysteine methyltransferase
MKREGIEIPVLLGGAALTRSYVENDCRLVYTDVDKVYYAKDAFSGLKLMNQIIAEKKSTNG